MRLFILTTTRRPPLGPRRYASGRDCMARRPALGGATPMEDGSLLFGFLSGLLNDRSQVETQDLGDTQKGVEGWVPEITFDKADHARGEPSLFGEAFHRKTLAFAFLHEDSGYGGTDEIARDRFRHTLFVSKFGLTSYLTIVKSTQAALLGPER